MSYQEADLLDLVEAYGADNGLISTETELSERFDSLFDDYDNAAAALVAAEYAVDLVALSEDFANYADSLVSEGELHSEQFSKYEYVGKFI